VISYDPCYLPEYYREFFYVPFGERKYKRHWAELDEIRRVLDFPFYNEKVDIDDIFAIPKDLRVGKKKKKIKNISVDLRRFNSKDEAHQNMIREPISENDLYSFH